MRALLGKALVDHHHLSSGRLLELEEVTRLAGLPVATFSTTTEARCRSSLVGGFLRSGQSEYRYGRVLQLRATSATRWCRRIYATRRLRFFTGTISAFVRDERVTASTKVLMFYRHWHAARQVPRAFMFVHDEAMHADPAVISGGSLQSNGTLTSRQYDRRRRLRLASRTPHDAEARNLRQSGARHQSERRPEAFQVRRGKIGGFRDHLSADDVAWIDACEADAAVKVHAARGVARPASRTPSTELP
ncbi:MAG: hypothetical protein IPI87_11830 [Betaproteobacteria bacterium]|nr:hypothetical protein [Betaproteobacteria bacterium]